MFEILKKDFHDTRVLTTNFCILKQSAESPFSPFFLQGQTFMALDPSRFAPNFEDRMDTFMTEMRNLPPVSGSGVNVLFPTRQQ